MPAVGVDISDTTIKFLQLAPSKVGFVPVVFGEERLEAGAVEGGEVRDPRKLAKGLTAVAARIEPLFVRASLPEQKAYFFTTHVPLGSSHDQVMQILEFQLEEHVPLSPAEAVVDYDLIVRKNKAHREHLDIGVTVYPRETVERYTEAIFEAGLFPLSLEIEAQAIERAVLSPDDGGASMVIDFGETSTGLSVVSHGTLGFTSTLDLSGSELTALMLEQGIDRTNISMVKNTVGIAGGREHAELTEALKQVVKKLGNEIRRHHSYWETHREEDEDQHKEEIRRVVLCGGNANLKGLPEYLEHMLELPVARANVWRNSFSFEEVIPVMPFEKSLTYATAIGLALRQNT
jgi:type IV pilus assembly protein PilM